MKMTYLWITALLLATATWSLPAGAQSFPVNGPYGNRLLAQADSPRTGNTGRVQAPATNGANLPEPPTAAQPRSGQPGLGMSPGADRGGYGTPSVGAPPLAPMDPSSRSQRPVGTGRDTIPLPPTAAPGPVGSSAGWVSGEAALSGGPFPGYMVGQGQQMAGSMPRSRPSPAERPFSNYSRPPSVSPYLNLYRNNVDSNVGVAGNYYTLVRPMLEQQKTNRAMSQNLQRLQNQVQQPATGGGTGRAVGRGGYFMNYYGFFPGAQ